LVLGRTPGVDAGLGAERAAFDHMAFLCRNREFVELLGRKIPVDRGQVLEAEFLGAVCAVPQTRFFHANLRPSVPTEEPLCLASGSRWEAGPIIARSPAAKAQSRRRLEC